MQVCQVTTVGSCPSYNRPLGLELSDVAWSICLYAADLVSCSCTPVLRYTVHQSCYLYNMSGNLVTSVHMLLVLPRYTAAWHMCLPQAAANGQWYWFVVDHYTAGSV